MIVKIQLYVESKEFSDPSVEKEVLQDLLRKSINQTLRLRKKELFSPGDRPYEYTDSYRRLIDHMKELEITLPSNKEVLERMRTGIKTN